jgi:Sucrose synthase
VSTHTFLPDQMCKFLYPSGDTALALDDKCSTIWALCVRCSTILKRWVSRFDVWPYLETFTIDVAHELRAAMGTKVRPAMHCACSAEGCIISRLRKPGLHYTCQHSCLE